MSRKQATVARVVCVRPATTDRGPFIHVPVSAAGPSDLQAGLLAGHPRNAATSLACLLAAVGLEATVSCIAPDREACAAVAI
jgi:hypothetical protein